MALDDETMLEIEAYVRGMHIDPVYYKEDVIPADSIDDIRFWLKTKLDFEGPPPDKLLIDQICDNGTIDRHVILDVDNNFAAEGRHRLSAALECGLDVPVVMISSRRSKGWKKF